MVFPLNVSGFSIFRREVLILTSFRGCSCPIASATPNPTSRAISSGMSMVASLPVVGSCACGDSWPIGTRLHLNRSSSSSSYRGGGDGDTAGHRGHLDGPRPPPPLYPVFAMVVRSGMAGAGVGASGECNSPIGWTCSGVGLVIRFGDSGSRIWVVTIPRFSWVLARAYCKSFTFFW